MNKFMAFSLGVIAGAAGAYYFVKKNIGDKMNTELNGIREFYRKKYTPYGESVEEAVEEEETKDIPIYDKPQYEETNVENPYPITPEEFGESEDYDMVTLRYDGKNLYRSGKNGTRTIVKNAEKIVGSTFAKWLGAYEPDVAYIRNDVVMTDYEIIRDEGGTDE